MRLLLGVVFLLSVSSSAFAKFLPDNDLWRQDNVLGFGGATMTEVEFNQVIDKVYSATEPSVKLHGGSLDVQRLWNDKTVNAMSSQLGNSWKVMMYGGLARRPEITPDGFTIVMCHEMGHHLGGYPYSNPIRGWAASEGQADYFATQVCARKVFAQEKVENAKSRFDVDAKAKQNCDLAWNNQDDQNLCYRVATASKGLALLLGSLTKVTKNPDFGTPDTSVVSSTNRTYASAQCRLDTYVNGSLCKVEFDLSVIPGREFLYQNGPKAEAEALKNSCTKEKMSEGQRPACWYKQRI